MAVGHQLIYMLPTEMQNGSIPERTWATPSTITHALSSSNMHDPAAPAKGKDPKVTLADP